MSTPVEGLPPKGPLVEQPESFRFTPENLEQAKAHIAKYPSAKEVVWCQEEPQNQGAWYRLRAYLRGDISDRQVLAYAGRPISASPAVGYMSRHLAQQKQLVEDAFAAKLGAGEMVVAH